MLRPWMLNLKPEVMRLQSNMWWLYHCAPEIPKQHILEDSGACNISFQLRDVEERDLGYKLVYHQLVKQAWQDTASGATGPSEGPWVLKKSKFACLLLTNSPDSHCDYDAGVWSSPRSRTAQFWFSSLANLRETNIICSSAVTYWHAITIQSSYRHFLCRYRSWYIHFQPFGPSLHCLDMRTRRSIVSCSCRSEQPVVEPNPEPGATLWKHWPFEGSMNRKSHGEIVPAYCPLKMAVRPHRKYAKIIENHSKKNIWEASWISKNWRGL